MSARSTITHCRLDEHSDGGLFAGYGGRLERRRTVPISGVARCGGGGPTGRPNPPLTVMLGIKALSTTGCNIRARNASTFNSAVSS
jgi:hypothetical protein